MQQTVDALYRGQIRTLEPSGKPSAIFKTAVEGPVEITVEGLTGDEQADRRFHGGPDKALHQYAQPDYRKLAAAFPQLASQLQPGSLGENLSCAELDGDNVCIGDIFQLGSARIQLSEPRRPCWKINHKFDCAELAGHIEAQGLTGWYYRVLEPGCAQAGDNLKLLERPNPDWPLNRFWQLQRSKQPAIAELTKASRLYGLSEPWQKKLADKAARLAKASTATATIN
ncbi:MOSC domain-containing protein [Marinobacterium arenosum]|uniref:MOSC domain-containing protein n=1 Tax=Marinobacterium arenosum TaxID=2862496 RepID=UPI001C9618C9|nr:MOSC domain-containing protein [Marinobacterium arenosum]MBY4675703.1 MOSC domain-containing protein [Marinobacterium arenosum]